MRPVTIFPPLLVLLGALLCFGLPASAARHALVIGNDAYVEVNSLQKAVNDAVAMGETLGALGFDVVRATDVGRRAMNGAIQGFTARLEPGDEAVIFYAGHGVEIDGRNYLLPTDIPGARPGQEDFIRSESIPVDEILLRIRNRGTKVAVLILDACRNNPFAREGTRSLGGSRGLARGIAPEGAFVMYSAGLGQTALDRLSDDDPHPNSVFTRSLIPLLQRPGLSHVALARQVRLTVSKLAATIRHEQRPAYYDEVTSDFFFAPPSAGDPAPAGSAAVAAASVPQAPGADAQAWRAVENAADPAVFEAFLAAFPDGVYAALARSRLRQLEVDIAVATPPVAEPRRDRIVHAARPHAPGETCARADGQTICVTSVLAAQDRNSYHPRNLADGRSSTAWVEGRSGQGVGEWILVVFDGERWVSALEIRNGYGKNADIYTKNSRLKDVEIVVSSGESRTVRLDDRSGSQSIDLSFAGSVEWLQMRILSVYPGSKYSDTAVSELSVSSR